MILLTGASGYLGRHVLAILEARGLPCVATSRSGAVGEAVDLAGPDFGALFDAPVDATIHCAAVVPKTLEDYNDFAAAEQSYEMVAGLAEFPELRGLLVFASSLTAANPTSLYAHSKRHGEGSLVDPAVAMRLPGLFGLPRRNGRMYRYAIDGGDYGTEPAMHVTDAAEYLVRAATMPSDGNREPFSVTYGDPRLEACYGSLGVTFEQRVREFVAEVQSERVRA